MTLFPRLLIALCFFPLLGSFETEAQYQLNAHYELLPQTVKTTDSSKIEVNELFSYHCGHCYNFQEMIHDWSQNLDEDVDFRRTHVVWNSSLENYAKAYNTALVLEVVDSVHESIFEAIHIRTVTRILEEPADIRYNQRQIVCGYLFPKRSFSIRKLATFSMLSRPLLRPVVTRYFPFMTNSGVPLVR